MNEAAPAPDPASMTAEEASAAVEAEPAPMTAAEAHAAAESEGLTLLRAVNSTGFKGVRHQNSASKPFMADLYRDGRSNYLGTFATAEEAALAVARSLGPEGIAALEAAAAKPEPMTAEEAIAAAEAEGLVLLRSDQRVSSGCAWRRKRSGSGPGGRRGEREGVRRG